MERALVGGVKVEAVQGDVTAQKDVEAIVNAANARLESGGGVAGAIHDAAGPGLAEEARPLAPGKPSSLAATTCPIVTSSTLWDRSTVRTTPKRNCWRTATVTLSGSPKSVG